MQSRDILSRMEIASPCPMTWNSMEGDDCRRFCLECKRNVYNLSSLSADDAVALIEKTDGRICGTFYRRADGTILTKDCPVGRKQGRRKRTLLARAAAALLLLGCVSVSSVVFSGALENPYSKPASGKIARACQLKIWELREWLGLAPQRQLIVGVMCERPVAPPAGGGSTAGN